MFIPQIIGGKKLRSQNWELPIVTASDISQTTNTRFGKAGTVTVLIIYESACTNILRFFSSLLPLYV